MGFVGRSRKVDSSCPQSRKRELSVPDLLGGRLNAYFRVGTEGLLRAIAEERRGPSANAVIWRPAAA
jgi:hypothetical protein